MENIWTLLPFFDVGVIAAVLARFTGMNLSMAVLLSLLYIGGTPVEVVLTMLVFNTFTYFTVYTQQHVMGIKELTFFPGLKMAIPLIFTIAVAVVSPFLGIIIFIAFFLAETFARMYSTMDGRSRPNKRDIVRLTVAAAALMSVGTALVQWFPAEYYYLFAGLLILLFALFMGMAGNRRKYVSLWDAVLYGSALVTGLCGIVADDWFAAMKREKESLLSKVYPIVIYSAMIAALLVGYGIYGYFPVGALFTTIGSALTIRFFGVYDYGTRGKFSYLALGMTVLAVLIFWLVQPVPTGLPEVAPVSSSIFQW